MMSLACVRLGWGVVLNPDEMGKEVTEKVADLYDDDLYDLLGVTRPPLYTMAEDPEDVPRLPITMEEWGDNQYGEGGYAVVFTRSLSGTDWGYVQVDPESLTASRTLEEVEALNKVLDVVGFTGDRVPQLLLISMFRE